MLSLAVASYGAASLLHASGFLAVYLSAVVLGNARLPHRPATRGFAEGVGWLAQIGLFVMLGLLADPGDLPAQIMPALIIGFVLLLIARPVSVVLSTVGFKLTWGEKIFTSWAGLRGAVPIVLATIPMVAEVPSADRLFAIVFNIVVLFTLLQGPTLPLVARWCRLKSDEQAREVDVEAAPLEELHADLLEVRIPGDSMLSGVEIFELRLPPGASVTLVVRDGTSFVPEPTTPLQAGDTLLVVTTDTVREAAERRLRAVSRKPNWSTGSARPAPDDPLGLSPDLPGLFADRSGNRPGRIVFHTWVPLAVVQSECQSDSAGLSQLGGTVPTYQYVCTECGEPLEVVQKFSDDALTECPACSGKLRKVSPRRGSSSRGRASTAPTAAAPASRPRPQAHRPTARRTVRPAIRRAPRAATRVRRPPALLSSSSSSGGDSSSSKSSSPDKVA